MKICWDNLEKLRYNHKTKRWYDKTHAYFYVDSCKFCNEPFLSRLRSKGIRTKFCSHSCKTRYYHKKRIIDLRGENNQNWKGGIKANNPDGYYGIWQKENPSICNAVMARRRARKLNQTPDDADFKKIDKTYYLCSRLNSGAGWIAYHVDHIIPLAKGGLHHHGNLRIIPAITNAKKGAKIL